MALSSEPERLGTGLLRQPRTGSFTFWLMLTTFPPTAGPARDLRRLRTDKSQKLLDDCGGTAGKCSRFRHPSFDIVQTRCHARLVRQGLIVGRPGRPTQIHSIVFIGEIR